MMHDLVRRIPNDLVDLILEARYKDEISSLLSEIEALRSDVNKLRSSQNVRAEVSLPHDEDALDQIIGQQQVNVFLGYESD